jgi:hypothetical protein
MAGPQYTSCVERQNFKPFASGLLLELVPIVGGTLTFAAIMAAVSAAAAAGLIAAWGVIALVVQVLQYTLDWMLNEKLICLGQNPPGDTTCGGDICAIGEVGDIEEVGEDKNPISGVDNDYCINLILAPVDVGWHKVFANNGEDVGPPDGANYVLARGNVQGNLITQQVGMPDNAYGGYDRSFLWFWNAGVRPDIAAALGVPFFALQRPYIAWTELFGHSGDTEAQNELWSKILLGNLPPAPPPVKYRVPVLHCEFEGSRIYDVLNAINAFSFGGKWCKKNWLFKLLCKILLALFAPAALAAALAAWASASGGSQKDALVDPAAGEVKPGDMVIMRGRWAYDGGHSGYNEMHAVRLLQRVYNIPQVDPKATPQVQAQQLEQFKTVQQEWCNRLCEAPTYVVTDEGTQWVRSGTVSEEQETVYKAQQQPENQWIVHPMLDGCTPKNQVGGGELPVIK